MRAGGLTDKLEVLEPLAEVNGFGEERMAYGARGEIRAERVQMGGRRSEEAGEHFPDYSVKYNVRYGHEVKENWRVKDMRYGYLYAVTNVIPNMRKGMKTLVCERVNE